MIGIHGIPRRTMIFLLIILTVGVVARVGLALGSESRFHSQEYQGLHDIKAWVDAGTMILEGKNPYIESYILDFGPVWAWICALPVAIAGKLGLGPFGASVLIKSILILADIAMLALICSIAIRLGRGPVIPCALFFLNPMSIILTGYVGQFDIVSVVPIAVLVLLLVREPGNSPIDTRKRAFGTGLLTGISAAVKHSSGPLFLFLPRMFGGVRKYLLSVSVALGVFLVLLVPYILDGGPDSIIEDIFGQQGRSLGTGWHWLLGIAGVVPSAALQKSLWALFVMLTALLVWRSRPRKVELISLYYVTIVLFVPSFGRHYFLYPVIFGGLAYPVMTLAFSFAASAYFLSSSMFSGPLAVADSPIPEWPAFLVLAVWWVYIIISITRSKTASGSVQTGATC